MAVSSVCGVIGIIIQIGKILLFHRLWSVCLCYWPHLAAFRHVWNVRENYSLSVCPVCCLFISIRQYSPFMPVYRQSITICLLVKTSRSCRMCFQSGLPPDLSCAVVCRYVASQHDASRITTTVMIENRNHVRWQEVGVTSMFNTCLQFFSFRVYVWQKACNRT